MKIPKVFFKLGIQDIFIIILELTHVGLLVECFLRFFINLYRITSESESHWIPH